MKFLSWLISLPFIVVCVLFAVNNLQPVSINTWPLDYEISMPLYIAVLGAFLLGLVLGATWLWFGSLKARWDKRKLTKEVDKLKTKMTEPKLPEPTTPPPPLM